MVVTVGSLELQRVLLVRLVFLGRLQHHHVRAHMRVAALPGIHIGAELLNHLRVDRIMDLGEEHKLFGLDLIRRRREAKVDRHHVAKVSKCLPVPELLALILLLEAILQIDSAGVAIVELLFNAHSRETERAGGYNLINWQCQSR